MPRPVKIVDPKILKAEIKDAKAALAIAKKEVLELMSAILVDQTKVKEYRAAVSEHIAKARAVQRLEEKLV